MITAWNILHIDLNEGIPALPLFPDRKGIYVVFWWQGVPLGHCQIFAAQLPMPATQVSNLALQAITPSIGDQLFSQGFKAPLSEHFEQQQQTAFPDFYSLVSIERPFAKLSEKWLKSEDASAAETISVIICTRDRPYHLERCLQSLQNLSYRPNEIIVVDNSCSSDETRHLVTQQAHIRYVKEPRPGLSMARNTGIRHSTGSIVAFTDDDVIVHSDWILRLRQGFKNPGVMVVTGLVLPGELETESQITLEFGKKNFGWGYRARTFDLNFFHATKHLGVPVWRIGAGANMAFRRQVFEQVGYFDERLGAGASGCSEDSEIWYRILAEGWLCHYEPKAVVHHFHRRTLDSLKRQMYQYMRGHVAALLIQFKRYKHWGNLLRLFVFLPIHYVKLLLKGLLRGFGFRHMTVLAEILGCIAGVKYYVKNRAVGRHI